MELIRNPPPNDERRRERYERFLLGDIYGDITNIFGLPEYDYIFMRSNFQVIKPGTTSQKASLMIANYYTYNNEPIWTNFPDFYLMGEFVHKKQNYDEKRRYFRGLNVPNNNRAVVVADKIAFVVATSPIIVRDFLVKEFPSGIICFVYYYNRQTYESPYTWEELLSSSWVDIISTPINIDLQLGDKLQNHVQLIVPTSIATAVEVKPTVWGLLEFTIWYQSNNEGLINSINLQEAPPVNTNPDIDTLEEVTTLPGTAIYINEIPLAKI